MKSQFEMSLQKNVNSKLHAHIIFSIGKCEISCCTCFVINMSISMFSKIRFTV